MADELERLRASWQNVARYRVIRSEPGRADVELGRGLTWDQARELERLATAAIEAEPGYRLVMSRPLALVELENKADALAACRADPAADRRT
jgi:hypothetical protein